MHTRITFILEN